MPLDFPRDYSPTDDRRARSIM